MLDIQVIRDNPEAVAEKAKQKGYPVDIPKLLELDAKRRAQLTQIEELRQRRNVQAAELKGQRPSEEQLAAGRQIKEDLARMEADLKTIDAEYFELLKQVPNMPLDFVPVGASEAENVVIKEVGEKPAFDFQPKTHWELAENRGLIDKERAGKVTGSRFAYIKGDLVRLQFAIIQFVMRALTNEALLTELINENGLHIPAKPFVPVLPPLLLRTEVYAAMDRLEPRDERYKVGQPEDDLWLEGSAEHTLGPMYMDEVL